jgi:transcriptional regulator with XRE-family HTH domain
MSQVHDFYREVGCRVRSARKRAGLTQQMLAARVALSRTSVTNIERGRHKMLLHSLWHIAEALGAEPSELIPELDANSATAS